MEFSVLGSQKADQAADLEKLLCATFFLSENVAASLINKVGQRNF